MQRMLAAACLVAGVLVLAGVGWALVAAGLLLGIRDERVEAWLRARLEQGRRLWSASRRMPRRALAGVSMFVGIVIAPFGALISFGVGIALMVAAGLMLGFSVLTGEGA